MSWLSLFFLAFAVSIDGLGVGVTYGIRKIRFPWWSLLIVTLLSALMILLAMGVGNLVNSILSPAMTRFIGSGILLALGCWAVYNLLSQRSECAGTNSIETVVQGQAPAATRVFRLEFRQLGLVIQILKTPSAADMDHSGSISGAEAVLLGLALSMDAFGAGISASLLGYPSFFTAAVISIMSLLFIGMGLKIGHKYAGTAFIRRMAFAPGILLIVIGLAKMFS